MERSMAREHNRITPARWTGATRTYSRRLEAASPFSIKVLKIILYTSSQTALLTSTCLNMAERELSRCFLESFALNNMSKMTCQSTNQTRTTAAIFLYHSITYIMITYNIRVFQLCRLCDTIFVPGRSFFLAKSLHYSTG